MIAVLIKRCPVVLADIVVIMLVNYNCRNIVSNLELVNVGQQLDSTLNHRP